MRTFVVTRGQVVMLVCWCDHNIMCELVVCVTIFQVIISIHDEWQSQSHTPHQKRTRSKQNKENVFHLEIVRLFLLCHHGVRPFLNLLRCHNMHVARPKLFWVTTS